MFQFVTKVLAVVLPSVVSSFQVQGHRGARGTMPENTLPAFEAGIEAGVDAMEMDLLMTKDGEIVIHHDFLLNPELCTHADGSPLSDSPLIKDMTLAELKKLDCGQKTNHDFPRQQAVPGSTIPTLKEVIDLVKNHPKGKNVQLNLEIKADPCTPEATPPYAEVAKKIVQIVNENGFADRVYYSSFDFSALEEVRKLDEGATIGLLVEIPTLLHAGVDPEGWARYLMEEAAKVEASILSPDYELISADDINTLQEAGFLVIPWTVNDPETCRTLRRMGVNGVITDYPADIKKLMP